MCTPPYDTLPSLSKSLPTCCAIVCAVLDGGVVAEFGPPHELLQREGNTAVFRSLVDETGPDYAATLKQQAAQVQCRAHHETAQHLGVQ